jgi:hypothetical protein
VKQKNCSLKWASSMARISFYDALKGNLANKLEWIEATTCVRSERRVRIGSRNDSLLLLLVSLMNIKLQRFICIIKNRNHQHVQHLSVHVSSFTSKIVSQINRRKGFHTYVCLCELSSISISPFYSFRVCSRWRNSKIYLFSTVTCSWVIKGDS